VDKQLVVAIYVDDLTLCGPDGPDRENFKTSLKKEFELSDLGPLNWLLGLQIEWPQDDSSVTIS